MNNTIKAFIIIALTAFIAACASYSLGSIYTTRILMVRLGMEYEKYMAWVQDREDYLRRVEEAKARKAAEELAAEEKKEARLRKIEAEKAGKK